MEQNFDGRKLFLARTAKKMSREKVAEKVGVKQGTIRYYEENTVQPKLGRINELAKAVEIEPEELLKFCGTKITKVKKNTGNIVGDHATINNNHCNHELEEIEKEILELKDIDLKTVFQIIKLIKKHKKQ